MRPGSLEQGQPRQVLTLPLENVVGLAAHRQVVGGVAAAHGRVVCGRGFSLWAGLEGALPQQVVQAVGAVLEVVFQQAAAR